MKFSGEIDLSKNVLRNALLEKLSSDPQGKYFGQMYFNIVDNFPHFFDGVSWQILSTQKTLGTAGYSLNSQYGTHDAWQITFNNETVTSISVATAGYSFWGAGMNSLLAGYIKDAGTAQKMTFSNNTFSTFSDASGQSHYVAGGNNGALIGYWFGDSSSGPITKVVFSGDTCSSLSSTIPTASCSCGFESPTYGYAVGGQTSPNQRSKIAFSNDALVSLSDGTYGGFYNSGCTYPTVAGYLMSKFSSGNGIERSKFSDESVGMVTSTLPVSVYGCSGFSSSLNGCAGAGNSTTQVQKLVFSNEATSTLASTMTGSIGYACIGYENSN